MGSDELIGSRGSFWVTDTVVVIGDTAANKTKQNKHTRNQTRFRSWDSRSRSDNELMSPHRVGQDFTRRY